MIKDNCEIDIFSNCCFYNLYSIDVLFVQSIIYNLNSFKYFLNI